MVAAKTLAIYVDSFDRLLSWWRALSATPSCLMELDEALCRRIEGLWAEGDGIAAVGNLLSSVSFFLPFSHGWTRRAWKLHKTWRRAEPTTRCAPMTPLIALGFAGACLALGRADAAALILVGFDGMLRSQSIFGLRRSHISFYQNRAVVRLVATKTTARRGGSELIVIQARAAVGLLRRAARGLAGERLILRRGPADFRRLFAGLIEAFGLQGFNLAVYSLRRGGASFDFLQHNSMERTLLRGHWQSTSAARVYVQDAVVEITSLQLTSAQRRNLQAAAAWVPCGLSARAR